MSQLILSRGVSYKKGILKKWFPSLELGPYFLVASLVVFVALITVITLMFSTRQVTKGYVLSSMESAHQDLLRSSKTMEMQISQVRSLNFIQDSSKVHRMVRPSTVVFVAGEASIASR